MPKAPFSSLPLSGLFAIAKPSGPTSMSILDSIKPLINSSPLFVSQDKLDKQKDGDAQSGGKGKGKFGRGKKRGRDAVKLGQGGTLDPLADGVLVVGIGKGTKRLGDFLDCVKEYRTTALLGCETDTYDSEGAQVRAAPWKHVTKDAVEKALAQFRGEIQQTPPIFSALKMDGKPLYEYARKGIPLPRPIERRSVTVHSLELEEWKGADHRFVWPEKRFTDDEKRALEKALSSVEEDPQVKDEGETAVKAGQEGEGDGQEPPRKKARVDTEAEVAGVAESKAEEPITPPTDTTAEHPTAFVLKMRVSGGTYVRSIVHDLGHALGSAAHVVTLTRSQQGRFALGMESHPAVSEVGDVEQPHKPPASAEANDLVTQKSEGEDAAAQTSLEQTPAVSVERGCVPWEVFERAIKDEGEVDEDGRHEWEKVVLEHLEVVD
ncbi:pseudouridine synthase [Coniophora puteana RWD-64-598 SS2]|uniref:tRNA pseudouridine(55) synthase n=1 Tax=Coniophora puteana (strain RWD-64-598) TaxID=741705 RepID=A0A5M3MDK5_CONPW|nr:pseudouridine synthase [Coniophora puteana RWD-64-598 SS2]EIW77339.1 pseudouridine synthase [Coniophora puteana RWD-64-598 SS2]